MLATASADDYRCALPLLLDDPAIDGVLAIFVPPLVTSATDVAPAVAAGTRQASKPVLAAFLGVPGAAEVVAPIPCYEFPESAAHALAKVVAYGRWRATPIGTVPVLANVDAVRARTILDRATPSDEGWLPPLDAYALLDAFGIARVPTVALGSEADAVDAARRFGFPVVLKGTGPRLVHKTEARTVRVNLIDQDAVREAYRALDARRAEGVRQIVMQPMVAGGVEFLAGAVLDPTFGHVIVCGSGGTMVELLHDTVCRLHPLTDVSAREMIDGLRGAALLRGYRGAPAADESGLRDILLRVSALVETCPEIADLDLNPIIVTAAGVHAADVRVRVEISGTRPRPSPSAKSSPAAEKNAGRTA
ncbi:MAG: acetate--CoA ligase family protein [Acidobacteria bacterium]|nr:acetate--CoA ligase family protein [Acidobacteriota bacterium]